MTTATHSTAQPYSYDWQSTYDAIADMAYAGVLAARAGRITDAHCTAAALGLFVSTLHSDHQRLVRPYVDGLAHAISMARAS